MAPLVTKLVDEHVAVLADAKRARSVAWSVAWFSTAGFHQMPPALSDRMKTSASQGWPGEHGVGGHHQIAAMRTRIPSGPVFDTAAWRGRVRGLRKPPRCERRVGGHGSRAAGAARESTTTRPRYRGTAPVASTVPTIQRMSRVSRPAGSRNGRDALFQSVDRAGEKLTGWPLTRRVVLAMIKRRGPPGCRSRRCCHTFRATGDHGVPRTGDPRARPAESPGTHRPRRRSCTIGRLRTHRDGRHVSNHRNAAVINSRSTKRRHSPNAGCAGGQKPGALIGVRGAK